MINGHYKLVSPSTKQMVSNECHKRERQVNQSRASGSVNFNGAEGVCFMLGVHRDFGTSLKEKTLLVYAQCMSYNICVQCMSYNICVQ